MEGFSSFTKKPKEDDRRSGAVVHSKVEKHGDGEDGWILRELDLSEETEITLQQKIIKIYDAI
jgi:hypothetical protein